MAELPHLNKNLPNQFEKDWNAAQSRYRIGIQNGLSPQESQRNYLEPVQAKWKIIQGSPALQTSQKRLDQFNQEFDDANANFDKNFQQYSRDGGESALTAPDSILPTLQKWSIAPSRVPDNRFEEALTKQDHAAALRERNGLLRAIDKLDPNDPDDAEKISRYQDRIDGLGQQLAIPVEGEPGATSAPASAPQPSTAGEVAPKYNAGGPASFLRLSNGGSVYFGPANGAPQTATTQPAPTAQAAPPIDVSHVFQPADMSGFQFAPGTGPFTASPPEPPADAIAPEVSPKQIGKRVALQKELSGLPSDTPSYITDALNKRAAAMDASATNAPAPFMFGPADATVDQHPDWSQAQQNLAKKGFLKGATPDAPKITSQADYDALEAGANYLDSQGNLRIKSASASPQ